MLPQRVSLIAFVATLAALPWLTADESKTAAVTIELRPQAGRLQVVTGTAHEGGVPVVLVRSILPGESWWVQDTSQSTERNGFSAKAVFGSARTAAGAKFRVVAIVADSKDEPFRVGQQIKRLPKLPASNQLLVTLTKTGIRTIAAARIETPQVEDVKDDDRPCLAELLSPKNGDNVERMALVKGRIDKGYIPVILARPLVKGSVWWVQKHVEPDKKGEFNQKVVFGSDKTPHGTRFRLAVLAVDTKEKAAEFKPGDAMRELPKAIPISREVIVTLRRIEKPASTSTEVSK